MVQVQDDGKFRAGQHSQPSMAGRRICNPPGPTTFPNADGSSIIPQFGNRGQCASVARDAYHDQFGNLGRQFGKGSEEWW